MADLSVDVALACVLAELEWLGVRAEGYRRDESGAPGVVVVRSDGHTTTYLSDGGSWDTQEEAESWALVVASNVRGVLA